MKLNNLCGIDVGCTNIKMMAIIDGVKNVKTILSGDDFTRASLIEAIYAFYRSFNNDFSGLGIAFSGGAFSFENFFENSIEICKQNVYTQFLQNLIFAKSSFDGYSGCIGAMKLVAPK